MKLFLRLRRKVYDADPAMDVRANFPMRLAFKERSGYTHFYLEQCLNGQLSWWLLDPQPLTASLLF
jgi:hypothetical protein